ncbi:MAG: hypothetical protein AAF573_08535 [Bacteroidota bacterium]
MRKATVALVEDTTRKEEKYKRIIKALNQGKLSVNEIAELFEVSVEYIEKIRNEEFDQNN